MQPELRSENRPPHVKAWMLMLPVRKPERWIILLPIWNGMIIREYKNRTGKFHSCYSAGFSSVLENNTVSPYAPPQPPTPSVIILPCPVLTHPSDLRVACVYHLFISPASPSPKQKHIRLKKQMCPEATPCLSSCHQGLQEGNTSSECVCVSVSDCPPDLHHYSRRSKHQ